MLPGPTARSLAQRFWVIFSFIEGYSGEFVEVQAYDG
jgi:hypothetical protein